MCLRARAPHTDITSLEGPLCYFLFVRAMLACVSRLATRKRNGLKKQFNLLEKKKIKLNQTNRME